MEFQITICSIIQTIAYFVMIETKIRVQKVFENNLQGCPLDQKISEFQYFANEGFILSALAIICIDNPMVLLLEIEYVMTVQNLVYFKIKNLLTSQVLNPRLWLMFLILNLGLKFILYLTNGIHSNSVTIYPNLLQAKKFL